MPPGCLRFKDYIRSELKMIRDRIEFHQKRMTRREGREVGHKEAKADYLTWLLAGNAKRFRRYFCSHCPDKSRCGWKPER
jgi:hypothetical protein